MKVLVVVPAYNEEDCIADVVGSIRAAGYPCVVVDDAGGDRTVQRAEAAGAAVVCLPINLGVGGALRTGWRYAVSHGYDVVVQVDGDGQHPVSHIEQLLAAMRANDLDMVIGSRFAEGGSHEGMSVMRRLCIHLLSAILRRFAHVNLTDPTSGFRAIRSPLLEEFAKEFPHHYLGDTFEVELVAGRRNYRLGEISIPMRSRQGGAPSAGTIASARSMVRALGILVTGTSFDIRPRESLEVNAAGAGESRRAEARPYAAPPEADGAADRSLPAG